MRLLNVAVASRFGSWSKKNPRSLLIPRVRRNALALLSFVTIFCAHFAQAESLRPEDIYQKILPSVMTLHVENAKGETYVGTAFLALDKNVAVTAWHVVSDAIKVTAKFSDDQVVEVVKLIDKDEAHDLALIQVTASNRPTANLNFANPAIGSRAYVIGAPKGFEFSISDGLISQIQKIHGFDEYQVSCPISGGNSGGPVVNERGEVVGITAWTQKDAQNLSFAMPANFLSRLNPKHEPSAWNQVEPNFTKAVPANPNGEKTSDAQQDAAAFKHLLNASAGKRLTITVSDGDSDRKFDVVLPGDFAR